MNILKRFRKSRSAARAQIKAAQARARAEVKHADKATARREKLLTKAERQLVKSEEKDLKRRRKHEHKQAKLELQKLREGRVNSGTVKRYAGTARAIAPLAQGDQAAVDKRQRGEDRRAHSMGLTSDELSAFSGHGASLKARTNGIRKNLAASALPAGFQKDAESRLDELDAAIDNAEYMTAQQRRRAHASIQGDIDGVTEEIQRRITSHK